MKAKCTTSIRVPLPDGTDKRFEAGTVYDVSDLSKDVVITYFETPESAPKKTTRQEGGDQ